MPQEGGLPLPPPRAMEASGGEPAKAPPDEFLESDLEDLALPAPGTSLAEYRSKIARRLACVTEVEAQVGKLRSEYRRFKSKFENAHSKKRGEMRPELEELEEKLMARSDLLSAMKKSSGLFQEKFENEARFKEQKEAKEKRELEKSTPKVVLRKLNPSDVKLAGGVEKASTSGGITSSMPKPEMESDGNIVRKTKINLPVSEAAVRQDGADGGVEEVNLAPKAGEMAPKTARKQAGAVETAMASGLVMATDVVEEEVEASFLDDDMSENGRELSLGEVGGVAEAGAGTSGASQPVGEEEEESMECSSDVVGVGSADVTTQNSDANSTMSVVGNMPGQDAVAAICKMGNAAACVSNVSTNPVLSVQGKEVKKKDIARQVINPPVKNTKEVLINVGVSSSVRPSAILGLAEEAVPAAILKVDKDKERGAAIFSVANGGRERGSSDVASERVSMSAVLIPPVPSVVPSGATAAHACPAPPPRYVRPAEARSRRPGEGTTSATMQPAQVSSGVASSGSGRPSFSSVLAGGPPRAAPPSSYVRRNVVQLRWQGEGPVLSRRVVLDLVLKMGFSVKDIYAFINHVGSKEFDLSFVQAVHLSVFWEKYQTECKKLDSWKGLVPVPVSHQSLVKKVTILVRNESIPAEDIVVLLKRYGDVLKPMTKILDEVGVWTGGWSAEIKLKTAANVVSHIPSFAYLGRDRLTIFYPGQPKVCNRCGDKGHFAASCPNIKCSLCQGLGHLAKDCSDMRCNLCGILGHSYSKCPDALHNKESREVLEEISRLMGEASAEVSFMSTPTLVPEKVKFVSAKSVPVKVIPGPGAVLATKDVPPVGAPPVGVDVSSPSVSPPPSYCVCGSPPSLTCCRVYLASHRCDRSG